MEPHFHAWRLVCPWLWLRRAAFIAATVDGRRHRAGDYVVYAWESSELAAMSMAHLAGAHEPTVLLSEKLRLPMSTDLYRETGESRGKALASNMARDNILGTWAPSVTFPAQHVLLLNPQHKMFSHIEVVSSRLITRRTVGLKVSSRTFDPVSGGN